MTSFHFELVAPEKLLFSGAVDSVIVPCLEGEMTVLANHSPVMISLKPGIVTVATGMGADRRLFVRGGFADVSASGLTILAESATPVEELDAAKFDALTSQANDDLARAVTDETKRLASEKIAQISELRSSLNI